MEKLKAFTLIEVMLALSIIAMAMLAAIQTTEATTRNLTHLQDRTLAQWVAQNALTSIQLHLGGLNSASGRWEATLPMGGREWVWSAVSNPTIDPNILQLIIEVRLEKQEKPLFTLVAYQMSNQLEGMLT
jgi:general secretion pathway protein I